jgi:hypothetical protein
VANQPGGSGSLALILGIAQFYISIGATLLFGIMPSGRMFGDWVASEQVGQVPRVSNFHDPTFPNAPEERLFMASCIRLQVHVIA